LLRGLRVRITRNNSVRRLFVLLSFWAILTPTYATVDDALSRAFEAFERYAKQGYAVREDDEWGGDLGVKEPKAIRHTLFKGNDYWFCMGTDVDNAQVAIHVYDNKGRSAEVDARQNGPFAAARVLNPTAVTYYIVVEVTSSPFERTHWAMVYGSKLIGVPNAL
jgi:hypothetical protein